MIILWVGLFVSVLCFVVYFISFAYTFVKKDDPETTKGINYIANRQRSIILTFNKLNNENKQLKDRIRELEYLLEEKNLKEDRSL